MRPLALLLALPALALASGAAAGPQPPDDGTLSVRNGEGSVTIVIRGSVIGRFDRGTLSVTDPYLDDGLGPLVRGAKRVRTVNDVTTTYSGTNVRFRLIGGLYTVRIRSVSDVDLSAVGQGSVALEGDPTVLDDGEFSLNGAEFKSLPNQLRKFSLQAPATG